VSELARAAWTSRFAIETEATTRFAELARRLHASGAPADLADLALRASRDELRHAAHCQRFASLHGAAALEPKTHLVEYAPGSLSPSQRLLYEVVAQCCVAETQSTATLVTLLSAAKGTELKAVLQELARDEVQHGRLGWAYLAWIRDRQDLRFLGALLQPMIAGSAGPDMFNPVSPEADSQELLVHGVLPLSTRQQLYVETLETVILPGFAEFEIDTTAARAWLQSRCQQAAHPNA
jgi:hypothetical protein